MITADLQLKNGQIPLTGVPSSQGYPNLVWNGVDYVVQWTDERDSSTDMNVRAVRINENGQVRDPNGIELSTAQSPAFGASLASTGNGSSLSLWSGVDGAAFRRTLAADASLGPLSSFGDPPLYSSAAVAGNGNGYLAVYMTGDSSNGAVSGRLLDAAGNGDNEFPDRQLHHQHRPNVFAAVGSGYLVSYSQAGTRIVPVSATGQVGASIQLSANASFVNAATSKTLVTWTDAVNTQVHAGFFTADGFSGTSLVLAATSAGYSAALSWDGSSYVAIWETPEHHLKRPQHRQRRHASAPSPRWSTKSAMPRFPQATSTASCC